MGGITGIIGLAGNEKLSGRLASMLAASPYRGNIQSHVEDGFAIGIQTLGWDGGLQHYNGLTVALHGYISNWDDILQGKSIDSPFDSEVGRLVLACEQHGSSLFPRLRGEFAAVVFDRNKQAVFVARDAFGCRPLYYEQNKKEECLLFIGTDIHQILTGSGSRPEANRNALLRFLDNNYDVADAELAETPWLGVSRFLPNRVYSITENGRQVALERTLWQPSSPGDREVFRSRDQAATRLRELLRKAVARCVPKQPSCLALSGGLDSTTILASLPQTGEVTHSTILPVSMVYPEDNRFDEKDSIREVRDYFGINGLERDMTVATAGKLVAEALSVSSMFGLANVASQLKIAKTVKEASRQVVLTGHGGDLLFFGSPNGLVKGIFSRDAAASLHDLLLWLKPCGFSALYYFPPRIIMAILRRVGRKIRHETDSILQSSDYINDTNGFTPVHPFVTQMKSDQTGWYLEPMEQIFASQGSEGRHPLLDLDLVDFVCQVPPAFLYAGGIYKGLLRRGMQGLLPKQILQQKKKLVVLDFYHKAFLKDPTYRDRENWTIHPILSTGEQRNTIEDDEYSNRRQDEYCCELFLNRERLLWLA